MRGKKLLFPNLELLFYYFLLSCYCIHGTDCEIVDFGPSLSNHAEQLKLTSAERKTDVLLPVISPSKAPQPFIPFLASSPLAPFTNSSVPRLSGLCAFNFSSVDGMISTTAIDCSAFFAPFLANVICCPQLHATLVILAGQSSKDTGKLALDVMHANHCLSDVQEILAGRGANGNLQQICFVGPSNLTEASCPINNVNEFESMIDTSRLLTACKKVDTVNECCSQICQNEILDAANKIAFKVVDVSGVGGSGLSVRRSSIVDDCRLIVLRWLASKLEPLSANQALRRISNCNLNKVCPLVFPSTLSVARYCKNKIENQTACCIAMGTYVSHLQKQSFITNLQALQCAASLGTQLEKANITKNVYGLCHITLKDFSLQVGSQESGCLLPSLPSDATFDQASGISFTCDLNDNIAAPWWSASEAGSVSSCNKTIKLPALPAATSSNVGAKQNGVMLYLLFALVIATLKL